MKKSILIALALVAFTACKQKEEKAAEKEEPKTEVAKTDEIAPEEVGKIIFEGKGTCVNCHKVDSKLIGPSLQDIAKKYQEKGASIVTFLKGSSDAIVDPSQFAVMQPNLELTKTFSDDELNALEAYMNSTIK